MSNTTVIQNIPSYPKMEPNTRNDVVFDIKTSVYWSMEMEGSNVK